MSPNVTFSNKEFLSHTTSLLPMISSLLSLLVFLIVTFVDIYSIFQMSRLLTVMMAVIYVGEQTGGQEIGTRTSLRI